MSNNSYYQEPASSPLWSNTIVIHHVPNSKSDYTPNIPAITQSTYLLITSFSNQMCQRKFHDVAKKLNLEMTKDYSSS